MYWDVQVTDASDVTNIKICVATVIDQQAGGMMVRPGLNSDVVPAEVESKPSADEEKFKQRAELLYKIMDSTIQSDVVSLQVCGICAQVP